MPLDLERQALQFMRDECWQLAKRAAFGRSRTYAGNSESFKNDFHRNLRAFLEREILPNYLNANTFVSDETHCANIQRICTWSQVHAPHLASGCLRIGIAQKLLNLYLKYLWCLGQLPHEPPHFPIDAIMLAELDLKTVCWTKLQRIDDYLQIIEAARDKASIQGNSLAVWELALYSERRY